MIVARRFKKFVRLLKLLLIHVFFNNQTIKWSNKILEKNSSQPGQLWARDDARRIKNKCIDLGYDFDNFNK